MRSAPVAVPLAGTIPAPQDVAYPGTIAVDIDATDVRRGLFRVRETIPVLPGQRELVLLLPEWIPGKHRPYGSLNLLADLHIAVDGKPTAWTRDPVTVSGFHVPLPPGARQVTATFVHTSPLQPSEGRILMTPDMLNLQWDKMVLYPAGYYARRIPVAPTATFPQDWQAFTALDGQKMTEGRAAWDVIDYQALADSPVFAGRNARSWDLGHDVRLDVVADDPKQLDLAPPNLASYRKLVDETVALFGARHFNHYDVLLGLSGRLGDVGLEHHRSAEIVDSPELFVQWDRTGWERNGVPHEFVHSWNGKFRTPARLWTPDFQTPMQGNLLWLYEGQTQLWGWVLAARSGLQPRDIVLGAIANAAGSFSVLPGRAWRSVEDTTLDPVIDARRPLPYATLSRNEDYYWEGLLVWLEADQIIREGTHGVRGLDDFARGFFGMNDGDWGELTYEFDDVAAALGRVYPYDWAGFLRARFQAAGAPAPLAGLEKGGYRLVWKDQPNPYTAGRMGRNLPLDYSLGFALDGDGRVVSTMWEGPAFKAGIVSGAQIVAVGGAPYSADVIRRAVTAAITGHEPIQLLVKRNDRIETVPIEYHGGLRYPWLERAGNAETGLDRLLAPRTAPTQH
ncbi:MAG: peptidase M61 [Croceibacterium sp.]